MTPIQYRAAIAALDLSQERAGVWLGIAPRTSQGYALGEYPVPEPVARTLRDRIELRRILKQYHAGDLGPKELIQRLEKIDAS